MGILLMNMDSSRSHCAYIFTVQQESVRDTRLKTGKPILPDLVDRKNRESWSEGKILEEAKTIYKSLSRSGNSFTAFLGFCEMLLVITRILRDALSEGTAKWLLYEIACRETDAERSLMHCRTHNGKGVVVVGNQKSGLDIAVECASLIHTASDSPAGKSTYSLIREPGELVKIKYTDVPLLYYTEILSMPGLTPYVDFHEIALYERIYLNSPDHREIIRLIMATVERGGHGDIRQRIRDEILLIQVLNRKMKKQKKIERKAKQSTGKIH
ncbi:hypothetical protein Syun_014661 [Stephania yunnanensis]|uniref:Uncharacterized protein n=1 Tax=Stephania yunnanensis TaxID=152371 RepID=A0AAP0JKU4_9MAGN